MEETHPAGLAKTVFELLFGLLGAYDKQKKKLFVDHVAPIQKKMRLIHKDYIEGFTEVKRHLEDRTKPPSELISFLEDRRRDYEIDRDLVDQLAKSLQNAERRPVRPAAWDSIKRYCTAVRLYFDPTSGNAAYFAHPTWYTSFICMLKHNVATARPNVWSDLTISGDPKGDRARQDLLNLAIITLRDLPEFFKPINAIYADLRAKLL